MSDAPVCGGTGESTAPCDASREVANAVRADVEKALERELTTYEVVSVRTQLVNGTNYFLKIQTGDDEFTHVRAHKALDGAVTHHSQVGPKTKDDELEHF